MGLHVPGSAAGEGTLGSDRTRAGGRPGDPPQAGQSVMAKHTAFVTLALVLLTGTVSRAQLRGVKADLTPVVESTGVHAGTDVRAAVQVRLPEGFHVQSNKPRDASLIPTVLTIDAPAGVTVEEIVFPPSTDLAQE